MKLLSKHKIFIVLFLALIAMFIGLFLTIENQPTNQTEAVGVVTHSYKYDVRMYNGYSFVDGATYVSNDGNTYNGSIGEISISTKSASGGSWSGSGATAKSTDETEQQIIFSAATASISTSLSWSYSITFKATAMSGFYNFSDSGTQTYSDKGTIPASIKPMLESEEEEYVVYFAPNIYTLAFYSQGKLASSARLRYYDNFPSKWEVPTLSGFTFKGYYTQEGEKVYDEKGDYARANKLYDKLGSTSLYARWVIDIEFNRNIASGTSDLTGGSYATGTTSLTATYDSTYPEINPPARNGYTFNGYYTSATGGTQIYKADGTTELKCLSPYPVLYAQWTAKTINITLDQQSGANGTTAFKYTYDTNAYYHTNGTALSLTLPTRTGYTFGGYWTGTGGGGTQYISASGNVQNELFKNVYADTTLYAKWTEHTYTIKFNPNGGSGTMADIPNVLYSASQTLTANAFFRYGYLFKGWAKNAVAVDANVDYLDQAEVDSLTPQNNGEVILYAVWEKTWAVDSSAPSGAGTQADPYQISTAKHLGWMAYQTETKNLSGYFKQTAHISLSNETWLPIGNATYRFIGNYDGNNYVITGLTTNVILNARGQYIYLYQGLYGWSVDATLTNIKLLSGTIYGNQCVGGIAGVATSSTIQNCQVGEVAMFANQNFLGGIVGSSVASTLTACYSKASINGDSFFGGIAGNTSSTSTLRACAFEGLLANTTYGYQMIGKVTGTSTKLYDCFAKTTTANGFVRGSFTKDSCLYIADTAKKYYSGNFTNWVIVKSNSEDKNPLILPQGLSWIATGGTKVTSINQITALGYTVA